MDPIKGDPIRRLKAKLHPLSSELTERESMYWI
jgi:hypothetical protein